MAPWTFLYVAPVVFLWSLVIIAIVSLLTAPPPGPVTAWKSTECIMVLEVLFFI